MTEAKLNPNPYDVALITVCVESDAVEQITAAVARMPWSVTATNCDNYLAASRRHPFPAQVMNADACVAVVDFDRDPALAVETSNCLNEAFFRRVALIALSSESNPQILLRAMRAGCSEFLGKPFEPKVFSATVMNLDSQWSNAAARTRRAGQVLSFFGAKGGVGTTTLAIHLAISLARLHHKKVLLIDNHVQFGHVCLYLGLEGVLHPFHELVRNVDRLDGELLHGFIASHPAGMDVLASPDTVGAVHSIDPASLLQTIDFLRGEYDYVVLDCEGPFDEKSLAMIDASDRSYLIATPDIGAVRNLSRFVDILMGNEQRSGKAHIVINRCSSEGAVNIQQIETAIRLPVDLKLPNSYAELVRAMNVGEPLSAKRKSEISSQFTRWANELVGTKVSEVERQSDLRPVLW